MKHADLEKLNPQILFGEIGKDKLKEIEKRYAVIIQVNNLKMDNISEAIRIFCLLEDLETITQAIINFLSESNKLILPISAKSIKLLLNNLE